MDILDLMSSKSNSYGLEGNKDNEKTTNFLGQEQSLDLQSVTYKDIIATVPSFISIDPSKTGTGYVKVKQGVVVEEGCYKIETDFVEDSVGMRREYRDFLIKLFGDEEYEEVFIENTIGSGNYTTFTILTQINPIVDDLKDMGIIKFKKLTRVGNTQWKKYLYQMAMYKPPYVGFNDVKKMIRDSLKMLGYGDGTTGTIKQDTYDAMGIAVGVLYARTQNAEVSVRTKKIYPDLTKGYKTYIYEGYEDALSKAVEISLKTGLDILELDFYPTNVSLENNFKKYTKENNISKKVYLLSSKAIKTGSIGLDHNINVKTDSERQVFIVAYRQSDKKGV